MSPAGADRPGEAGRFSDTCYEGVGKIKSGLEPWDIVAAASNGIKIADGTTETMTISQAYGDPISGRAAQAVFNRDHAAYLRQHGLADFRVKDRFAVDSGVHAYTPVGGGVIYISAGLLQTSRADRNQAFLMHEILHNEWGLDDSDVLDALYGKGARDKRPPADITEWFRKNCVSGKGNS